jgi:TolB-like protein
VILGLAAAGFWWVARRQAGAPGLRGQVTLAVLPFQNLNADASSDYLRLALPDEVATTLSYVPTLAIRPFASTQKYAKGDVDSQAAGRELRVARILAGHFLKEGERLLVTLEVVDIDSNRLLWRDTSSAAVGDLIGLKEQISRHLRQGLFPLLGATAGAEAATHPKSQEAYDLYLRGTAIGRDPGPNKDAILLLEKSVALDPTYAPAWGELGHRYYFDGIYGGAGPAARQRARECYERALSLDPNFSIAAGNLAIDQVEGGELLAAHARAADLVRRRPEIRPGEGLSTPRCRLELGGNRRGGSAVQGRPVRPCARKAKGTKSRSNGRQRNGPSGPGPEERAPVRAGPRGRGRGDSLRRHARSGAEVFRRRLPRRRRLS